MERVIARAALPQALTQLGWEARRAARAFARRFGGAGWILLGCAFCVALALSLEWRQRAELRELEAHLSNQLARNAAMRQAGIAPVAQPASHDDTARMRLKAFDDQLLRHENIPFVVKSLLELGEAEGLTMQRGNYRPQVDVAGGFMRYQMSFPVKGSAAAIQRYMKAALRKQGNLALDSVQFKRAHIGSSDIEARIQWVMLTRLPTAGGAVR